MKRKRYSNEIPIKKAPDAWGLGWNACRAELVRIEDLRILEDQGTDVDAILDRLDRLDRLVGYDYPASEEDLSKTIMQVERLEEMSNKRLNRLEQGPRDRGNRLVALENRMDTLDRIIGDDYLASVLRLLSAPR